MIHATPLKSRKTLHPSLQCFSRRGGLVLKTRGLSSASSSMTHKRSLVQVQYGPLPKHPNLHHYRRFVGDGGFWFARLRRVAGLKNTLHFYRNATAGATADAPDFESGDVRPVGAVGIGKNANLKTSAAQNVARSVRERAEAGELPDLDRAFAKVRGLTAMAEGGDA